MTFDSISAFADGGLTGFETPPARTSRRRPGRRSGVPLLAFCVALGLHASLLLLWRATRPPFAPEVVGQGGGSGGISLTLVRGSAGGAFAPSARSDSVDPEQQTDQASGPQAADEPATTSSGVDSTTAPVTGAGHGAGDVGATADIGNQAAAGSGYDPGAFASLAPLSFARISDPGLSEQVKRCLKGGASTPVTLSVVIDDQGVFVNAYKAVLGLATQQPPGEAQAIADTVQALKDCSPYRGLAAGLVRPLTLVLPAAAVR